MTAASILEYMFITVILLQRNIKETVRTLSTIIYT